MDGIISGLIAAIVGGVSGYVSAFLTNVIERRKEIDEGVRSVRTVRYAQLWRATVLLPKWPRDEAVTYEDVGKLSEEFRGWYFGTSAPPTTREPVLPSPSTRCAVPDRPWPGGEVPVDGCAEGLRIIAGADRRSDCAPREAGYVSPVVTRGLRGDSGPSLGTPDRGNDRPLVPPTHLHGSVELGRAIYVGRVISGWPGLKPSGAVVCAGRWSVAALAYSEPHVMARQHGRAPLQGAPPTEPVKTQRGRGCRKLVENPSRIREVQPTWWAEGLAGRRDPDLERQVLGAE
jgi:hypothetical protein